MSVSEERVFDLSQYLVQRKESSDVTAPDLLILNQPISDFAVFVRLWAQSKYRLCADGGANHLYDMFSGELEARRTDYIPDSIHGDLDSVRDDVRSFYAHHGTQVTQLVDDYSTDFAKAMQKITANNSSASSREVLVLGTLAGRVDHAFGMLHDMIREETTDPRLRLWLYSETNVSFILRNPHNIIKGALSNQNFTENVGILPVYGPATISTAGLEWDVRDWATRLGTQVSTSNHVKADEIHIRTNAPVLFTIERAASSTDSHATPAQ